MTRVAILTAVELEARTLAHLLGLPRIGTTGWSHFGAGPLELVCVGLRAAHLESRGDRLASPGLVISAGACGGLSPDLAEGALVVPEVVVGPTGSRYATTAVSGLVRAGTLATVGEVVATRAAKARLWFETGALACDMESATILAWAQARGIPAAVLRAVSDTATREVPEDLAALVGADGRVRTARAVRAMLARPRALADALALRSGTRAALESVARELARIARARA